MRLKVPVRAAAAAALGVVVFGGSSAHAALTSPVNGGVYRGDVPFNEDTGGRMRSALTPADVTGPTGTPQNQTQLDSSAGYIIPAFPPFLPNPNPQGCLSKSSSSSNSTNPLRTLPASDTASQGYVTITRNGATTPVLQQGHASNQIVTSSPAPWDPQPFGGTWATAGNAAGMYTARSYKRDIVRGDPSIAVLPTDTSNQRLAKRNPIATCRINAATTANDVLVSSVTFEYRPWEQRFKDTLQNAGGVDFNLNSSREFQLSLPGGQQSPIINAPQAYTVVALPKDSAVVLPPDPSVCANHPELCLPATPASCSSDPSSCSDRLVLLSYGDKDDGIIGVFDLETRAFVADVKVGDSVGLLKSAGAYDAQVAALKQQLFDEAAALGINAAQVSAMQFSFINGDGTKFQLSLDEGLATIAHSGAMRSLTVNGGPAVAAGVIVHLASGTYKGTPNATGDAGGPYKIYGSALSLPPLTGLPALPALPAPLSTYAPLVSSVLGTGAGVRQIKAAGYTSGQHVYALAVGVEPSQTPHALYIPPDAGAIKDKSIDFVGVPLAILQGGVCNASGDCVGGGLLTGAGAAIYDSPVTIPQILL